MFQSRWLVLAALTGIFLATAANAGPVLDRVHAQSVVHCGSFERPGIAIDVGETQAAAADAVGQEPVATSWHGLAVDLCRAVADAVLGSPDKIDFHSYAEERGIAVLTQGEDDIAFLTASEMHAAAMTGHLVPGPVIYVESIAAMTPISTGARHLGDVDPTKGVCFATGSAAAHVLSGYFESKKIAWLPEPYTEDGEMLDAYNAQMCHVLAGERTSLAMTALEQGVNNLKSTILPEALVSYPIMATTSQDDGQWASIVAWTMYTLMAGNRPSTDWTIGGAATMPVSLVADGLNPDWQDRLLRRFGSYDAIVDNNLGAKSALHLPIGLNAGLDDGGVLVAPFLE